MRSFFFPPLSPFESTFLNLFKSLIKAVWAEVKFFPEVSNG